MSRYLSILRALQNETNEIDERRSDASGDNSSNSFNLLPDTEEVRQQALPFEEGRFAALPPPDAAVAFPDLTRQMHECDQAEGLRYLQQANETGKVPPIAYLLGYDPGGLRWETANLRDYVQYAINRALYDEPADPANPMRLMFCMRAVEELGRQRSTLE